MLVLLTVVSKSFFLLVTVYLTGNLGSQTPLTVSQPRVMTGFPMLSFCHVGQCEQVHLSNNLSQPTTCLCEQLQRIIFSPGDEHCDPYYSSPGPLLAPPLSNSAYPRVSPLHLHLFETFLSSCDMCGAAVTSPMWFCQRNKYVQVHITRTLYNSYDLVCVVVQGLEVVLLLWLKPTWETHCLVTAT